MFKQLDKQKKSGSRVAANSIAHKKNSQKKILELVDNRPEVVAQRKIKTINNNLVIQCRYHAYGAIFTQNKNFGVKIKEGDNFLYAKDGYNPAPVGFFTNIGTEVLPTKVNNKRVRGGGDPDKEKCTFNKFSPKARFDNDRSKWADYIGPNDCLYYAAALAHDNPRWDNPDSANENSRWHPMKQKHDSQAPNFSTSHDDGQDPVINVQETYFMRFGDPTKKPDERCNHHGSTVIAVDGTDKVTSEADASAERIEPKFQIYGPTGDKSFYEEYNGYYTDNDGNNAVLTTLKS